MAANKRQAIWLITIALILFALHWMLDDYVCNPQSWHSSQLAKKGRYQGQYQPWRPPQSEGATFFTSILRGGGGTPAVFAMFGGQRYLVANILWNYSDVLFHKGQPFDMVYPLESAVTLNPGFIDAWSVYGWHEAWNLHTYSTDLAAKWKWLKAGEAVYQRAVDMNPQNPRPYFDQAWLYLQRFGDYQKGLKPLQHVVESGEFEMMTKKDIDSIVKFPGLLDRKWNPQIYGHRLAYAYKLNGYFSKDPLPYFKKAIATYQVCLDVDPQDDVAIKNKAQLEENMHNTAWIAEQRKTQEQIRINFGMGAMPSIEGESPGSAFYGQDERTAKERKNAK